MDNNKSAQLENLEAKMLLKKFRFRHIVDINMVRIFFIVLFIITIVSLIPTLRESYSETEKRKLASFPKFTVESLASGEFFDGISLWFSDTFPFRDKLITVNSFINGTFGKTDIKVHGTLEQGDDIPDVPSSIPDSTDDSLNDDDNTSSVPVPQQPTRPLSEQLGAILVVDNAAYEYYNFNKTVSENYSLYLSRAADMLEGKATVYGMIVPTSMGITAPEDIVANINVSDQRKAMEYMYSMMSPNVVGINTYDIIKAHKDEYLYFRTDHHWTARGAYYAYYELMDIKGVRPAQLTDFIEHRFDGFLGSFYSKAQQSSAFVGTPDSVYAYEPRQTNIAIVTGQDGQVREKSIISDGNNLGSSSKYLSFVSGDNPLTVMTNPEITDDSACIVIKESFGNAFVPFLTQNYSKVYVVDYRYFSLVDDRKLYQLVTDTGATDVIFLNNISATRSAMLVDAIGAFVGEPPPPQLPDDSLTDDYKQEDAEITVQ